MSEAQTELPALPPALSTRQRFRRLLRRQMWNAVEGLGWLVFATLGAIGWLRRGLRRPDLPRADTPSRILVIRTDLLGDVVMSLPAVSALKNAYPLAEIHMLALPYTEPLLEGSPYLHRLWTYDVNRLRRPRQLLSRAAWAEFLDLIAELRAQRFDLALSLFGLVGCVLSLLSGAHSRVGYRGEAYPLVLTHPLAGRRYERRLHEIDYCLALAEAAGGHLAGDPYRPELPLGRQARASVAAVLREFEVGPRETLVAVHVGASNGSAKRWFPAHWAVVCDRLAADLGAKVVITGSASEYALAREVVARSKHKPIVLAGRTTIPQLVALLARADLVITGDSAPLHIAAALDRPVIGIFGPTDPTNTGPRASRALVLREDLPCSPCYNLLDSAECPRRDFPMLCMQLLSPRRVMEAAVQLLAQSKVQSPKSKAQSPPPHHRPTLDFRP